MNDLAKLLIKARTDLGEKSRRKFFLCSGGEEYFCCTYRFYSLIEEGKSFPEPELLLKLLSKLKVFDIEKYVMSLIKSKLKSEETEMFFSSCYKLEKKIPQSKINSTNEPHNYYNEEQLKLLASAREINWLFNLFLFNRGSFSLKKIADFTNIDSVLLETYLKRLIAVNLICLRRNRYKKSDSVYIYPTNKELSPLVRKIIEFNASFSPHTPIDKNSLTFKIRPDVVFIIQKALKEVNSKIISLASESDQKGAKPYFYHSAIFERKDLDLKIDKK